MDCMYIFMPPNHPSIHNTTELNGENMTKEQHEL